MKSGTVLLISLGIILLLIISIQYFLWQNRIKDKKSINDDWEKFLKASKKNDIMGIRNYGTKLVWNKYLKQDQLSKIKEVVENKIERHPELEKLKLDSFNKQLSYDRITLDSKRFG